MPSTAEILSLGFALGNFEYEPEITKATWHDAQRALACEMALVARVEQRAHTVTDFETLLDMGGETEDGIGLEELWGLEPGIAGATLAVAASGCVPFDSCRGHLGQFAGNGRPHPYVCFQSDRPRARVIRDISLRAGAGFACRPSWLQVYSPSLREMLRFADLLIATGTDRPHPAKRTLPEGQEGL
jgi:hypothetical protein